LRYARLERGLACSKCVGGSVLSKWLGGGLSLCKSCKCDGSFLQYARLERGLACKKCGGGSVLSKWLGGGLSMCKSCKFSRDVRLLCFPRFELP
jgi:hypothetical protein